MTSCNDTPSQAVSPILNCSSSALGLHFDFIVDRLRTSDGTVERDVFMRCKTLLPKGNYTLTAHYSQ